jgi:hypothetical protein
VAPTELVVVIVVLSAVVELAWGMLYYQSKLP